MRIQTASIRDGTFNNYGISKEGNDMGLCRGVRPYGPPWKEDWVREATLDGRYQSRSWGSGVRQWSIDPSHTRRAALGKYRADMM